VFLIGIVSAVPAAPSPTCKVTANVLNSTYQPAYFQEDNGIPCNSGGRDVPSSYLLQLKINSASTVTEDGSMSCDELYPLGKEISVILYNPTRDYSGVKVIEGDIHFGGDECNGGIFLTNYKIINNEPEKELTFFQKIINWFKRLFS
jgi:hypothetical protein